MTGEEFAAWLAAAKPDEMIEYYRGFLFDDARAVNLTRRPHSKRQEFVESPRTDATNIEAVRMLAAQAAELGHVHLLQKRHGKRDYSYLAVRKAG